MPISPLTTVDVSSLLAPELESWTRHLHDVFRVPAGLLRGSWVRPTHVSQPEPSVLAVLDSYEASNYDFAKVPNWDGKGAVALTDDVIRLADKLADDYGSVEDLIEVKPQADGSLVLVWEDETKEQLVHLAVGPKAQVRLWYKLLGRFAQHVHGKAGSPNIIKELQAALAFTRIVQYVDAGSVSDYTSVAARGGGRNGDSSAIITYHVGGGGGGNGGGGGGGSSYISLPGGRSLGHAPGSGHAFGMVVNFIQEYPPEHPNCRSVARANLR